jgi:hypothetical protein
VLLPLASLDPERCPVPHQHRAVGGCRVEPFEGDPWDEELLGMPEAVEASGD